LLEADVRATTRPEPITWANCDCCVPIAPSTVALEETSLDICCSWPARAPGDLRPHLARPLRAARIPVAPGPPRNRTVRLFLSTVPFSLAARAWASGTVDPGMPGVVATSKRTHSAHSIAALERVSTFPRGRRHSAHSIAAVNRVSTFAGVGYGSSRRVTKSTNSAVSGTGVAVVEAGEKLGRGHAADAAH
jgi:hypothetical protein